MYSLESSSQDPWFSKLCMLDLIGHLGVHRNAFSFRRPNAASESDDCMLAQSIAADLYLDGRWANPHPTSRES